MSMFEDAEKLWWIDTETFGVNPGRDLVIEVGIIVTDLDLEILDQEKWLVWSPVHDTRFQSLVDDALEGDKNAQFVINMHRENGLFGDARENGRSFGVVQREIIDWLKERGVTKKDPLCGSTVGFDRNVLYHHLPHVLDLFSYRVIDVSSLKELCMRYNPRMYEHMEGDVWGEGAVKGHRVIEDLEDTIAEFEWYLDNFLFVDLPGQVGQD